MRRVALVLGMVALVAGLAACGRGRPGGEGTLRSAGDVLVGQSAVGPDTSTRLRAGDVVDVREGSAVVDLPSGAQLELRKGSVVRFAGGPSLQSGDLLADGARVPVGVTTIFGTVTVPGVARLSQQLALTVAVYRGQAHIDASRSFSVPALQQATVASVNLAPGPVPFDLHASDGWDQQFLGQAIELTTELDSQSRYVSANAPVADAAFYRSNLPQLATLTAFNDGLIAAVAPGRLPAGDGLVAAAIALAGKGPFGDRFQQVFALRQQGAQWGIVALSLGDDPATVLRLVGSALTTAELVRTEPVATPAPVPVTVPKPVTTTPPTVPAAPPKPGPTTTTQAPKRPAPTTTTTAPPTTLLPPPVAPLTPVAPVLDPVQGIVHSLLGGS